MSKWILAGFAAALFILFTGDETQARSTGFRDVQELHFCLTESVKGNLLPPRCELLEVRVIPALESLIEYRIDFVPELSKAAEQL